MCEKGVNTAQLALSVGQAADVIGVAQGSLEQLHHLADHGGRAEVSALIAQASVLLGEAAARLEEAATALDEGGENEGVTVERM